MPRNHQIWPEFGISDHCWLIRCPVDGLAGGCGARAVSRKTPIYFIIEMSPGINKKKVSPSENIDPRSDQIFLAWYNLFQSFQERRGGRGALCKLRRLLRSMTALAPSKGDTTQWTRAGRLEGLSLIHFGFQSSFYLRSCK